MKKVMEIIAGIIVTATLAILCAQAFVTGFDKELDMIGAPAGYIERMESAQW